MQILKIKKIILKLLLLLIFKSCNYSEPNLYFPSSEILLGDVKVGSDKMIVFQIENRGNQSLFIKNVNSSCKCIDIKFSKKKIIKNQKANISMIYKADEIGLHEESIVIISNDPNKFNLQKIKVNVVE